MSGISSNMRALRQSTAPEAAEAVALFVYRMMLEIGSLAAAFTAGIGEERMIARYTRETLGR
ncbi:MAG: hypothetical protein ACXWLB_07685 [Reyranella sp.]